MSRWCLLNLLESFSQRCRDSPWLPPFATMDPVVFIDPVSDRDATGVGEAFIDYFNNIDDSDLFSDLDDGRPLGLQGLPVTYFSSRWLRMANFAHDTRMDVWCVTVLLRLYMRMYGPWSSFLNRWHRMVLMALTAMQTRNMGVPYPFGRVATDFLNRLRRS